MTTATLADHVAAHEQLLGHFAALTHDLDDQQLAAPSLCPGWSVRDVITHVLAVEVALDGWQPTTDAPPFAAVGTITGELDALDRDAFAARADAIVASRLTDLAGRPAAVVDAPSFTPAGPDTYGRFLQIRVFDQWVHARDIARPLGLDAPGPDGLLAETAVSEVAAAIGYIVGKKIGLPDGASIVFHLTGGVVRDLAVEVDGRARVVPAVESPTVEVTADADTFVMLACGRIDPDAEIAAGRITWVGDAEWGERAARNLRYTI